MDIKTYTAIIYMKENGCSFDEIHLSLGIKTSICRKTFNDSLDSILDRSNTKFKKPKQSKDPYYDYVFNKWIKSSGA